MITSRLWWAMPAIMISTIFLGGSIFAQSINQSALPEVGTLYLQVGNVDTAQFENLLEKESTTFSLNSSNQFCGDYLDHDLRQQPFCPETPANPARWAADCGSARHHTELIMSWSLHFFGVLTYFIQAKEK